MRATVIVAAVLVVLLLFAAAVYVLLGRMRRRRTAAALAVRADRAMGAAMGREELQWLADNYATAEQPVPIWIREQLERHRKAG